MVKQARKTTEAEGDGTEIVRNVGFLVPFHTASLLRRLEYLASPLRDRQIFNLTSYSFACQN